MVGALTHTETSCAGVALSTTVDTFISRLHILLGLLFRQ